jgi:hypothetical protein
MEADMRRRGRTRLALVLAVLSIAPAQAHAKWSGGIILLPAVDVAVDGQPLAGGVLDGDESVETGEREARIYVRGPRGQALVVLAPGTSVALSGSLAKGFVLDIARGAVRLVIRPAGNGRPVSVEGVEIEPPGGVVLAGTGDGEVQLLTLDDPQALELFPPDAPAAAASLGMPATGLPLVGQVSGEGSGGEGAGFAGGAEVEGESMCIDSATGPEGSDPTTDGVDPTEIDRTKTRVILRVRW